MALLAKERDLARRAVTPDFKATTCGGKPRGHEPVVLKLEVILFLSPALPPPGPHHPKDSPAHQPA
ncbi:MAG: hypothetical protein WCJ63_09055, partial [Actinomycetes bacterium]